MIYYETGIEEPEILGSGSSYHNIFRTQNEKEAIENFYTHMSKNCLWKINNFKPIEFWDTKTESWVKF